MKKTTPEKTHTLLEKLAEYVMNEVSTKKEVDEKIGKLTEYMKTEVAKKSEVNELRTDVKDLKQKVDIIITGQDKQAKQLDDLKTEQTAFHSALLRHEKRITVLEQN